MKYYRLMFVFMLLICSMSLAKGITIEVVPSGPAGIRGEGPDIPQDKQYNPDTDVIVLKNGDTIEGNIVGYSSGIYRIKIGGFIKPVNENTIKTINNEYISEKEKGVNNLKKRLTATIYKHPFPNPRYYSFFAYNNYLSSEGDKIILTNKGVRYKKLEDFEKYSLCSSKRYEFDFFISEYTPDIFQYFYNLYDGKYHPIYIFDKQKDKKYPIRPNNSNSTDRVFMIPLAQKDNKFYACLLENAARDYRESDKIKTNKSNIYDVYCFDFTKSMFPIGPIATCKIDEDIILNRQPDDGSWWRVYFDEQVGLFRFLNANENSKENLKIYDVQIDKTGNYEIKFNKKLKIDFSESVDKGEMKFYYPYHNGFSTHIDYNYGYFIDKNKKHFSMVYCREKLNNITNKKQLYVFVKIFDESSTKPILDEEVSIIYDSSIGELNQLRAIDIDEDGLKEIVAYPTGGKQFVVVKIK